MPCVWLKDKDGNVMIHMHVGRGGGKKKPCPFCKKGRVSKLCDYPVGGGKTCDAEMCDNCSRTLGYQDSDYAPGLKRINDTWDVCPNHRGMPRPKE